MYIYLKYGSVFRKKRFYSTQVQTIKVGAK